MRMCIKNITAGTTWAEDAASALTAQIMMKSVIYIIAGTTVGSAAIAPSAQKRMMGIRQSPCL